jgi:hypothetical protein
VKGQRKARVGVGGVGEMASSRPGYGKSGLHGYKRGFPGTDPATGAVQAQLVELIRQPV